MNKFYQKLTSREALGMYLPPTEDFTDSELSWLINNLRFCTLLDETESKYERDLIFRHYQDIHREKPLSKFFEPNDADLQQIISSGPHFSMDAPIQVDYTGSNKLGLPAKVTRVARSKDLKSIVLGSRITKRADDWFMVGYCTTHRILEYSHVETIFNQFCAYYKCDGFRGLRIFLQDHDFVIKNKTER